MAHVLIVDDEQSICWALSKLVRGLGHAATIAPSAERALQPLPTRPDLILLDVRLPGMDGLTAMPRLWALHGRAPIIVMTAFGDLETAVAAMRQGAFEYLVKPFELNLVQRAIERGLETPQVAPARAAKEAARGPNRLVGASPAIQEVFRRIAFVAPAEACAHVRGESGTGKELVARAIHQYSRRATGPFVPVNIAALSPSIAESELFGHVRGAFTGADVARKGLLEQAHGGTIFLDEVADIPMSIQVKLLRAIEYGEILPVGSATPIQSDFRLISATHQDLRQRVTDGSFRQDLYFRLITFEIEVPPLRERQGDLPGLAEHFLEALAVKNGCARVSLAPETVTELAARPWYGNVRELRNVLEHAMILARGGAILPEHLPAAASPPPSSAPRTRDAAIAALIREWTAEVLEGAAEDGAIYTRLLQLVEPPLLQAVLHKNRGQFLAAAKQLGLHRVTLRRKVSRYRNGE